MLVPASTKLWLCALSVALSPHHFHKARDSHTTSGHGSTHEKWAGDRKQMSSLVHTSLPWEFKVPSHIPPLRQSFETGVETKWVMRASEVPLLRPLQVRSAPCFLQHIGSQAKGRVGHRGATDSCRQKCSGDVLEHVSNAEGLCSCGYAHTHHPPSGQSWSIGGWARKPWGLSPVLQTYRGCMS